MLWSEMFLNQVKTTSSHVSALISIINTGPWPVFIIEKKNSHKKAFEKDTEKVAKFSIGIFFF